MNIIQPEVRLISAVCKTEAYNLIEEAARVCYKSSPSTSLEGQEAYLRRLIASNHTAMIEHYSVTMMFTNDRGVSHEEVRHRIGSFGQESTRYCNYSRDAFGSELNVIDIRPIMQDEVGKRVTLNGVSYVITQEDVMEWIDIWTTAMLEDEKHYMQLVSSGCPPQLARGVLSNSLKTQIVITFNLREWRHFFLLRYLGSTGQPHPQMRQVASLAFNQLYEVLPVFFEDIKLKAESIGLFNSLSPWKCRAIDL